MSLKEETESKLPVSSKGEKSGSSSSISAPSSSKQNSIQSQKRDSLKKLHNCLSPEGGESSKVISFLLDEGLTTPPQDGIDAYAMLPSQINSGMLDDILGDLDDDD